MSPEPCHLSTQVRQYACQLIESGIGSVRLLALTPESICSVRVRLRGQVQLHIIMASGHARVTAPTSMQCLL